MTENAPTISHFDVAGNDIEALGSFYKRLFNWKITTRGPGYAQLGTPGLQGAIVETPEASITLGIAVPDLAAALTKSEEIGGTIEMPATDNGWVVKAQIRDPAGNLLTLIQR